VRSDHRGDWLENSYIPDMDGAEHHKRSRLAVVDPVLLKGRFESSKESSESFERDRRDRLVLTQDFSPSKSAILFEMFPGESYRVSVVHYKVSRNSGMLMVNGLLIGEGFTGREREYFEVTLDGKVRGSVITKIKM